MKYHHKLRIVLSNYFDKLYPPINNIVIFDTVIIIYFDRPEWTEIIWKQDQRFWDLISKVF